ncbi:hypothetical protein HELRODRAFT_171339 [Helobdella robusta]|uniref:Uncharacterized protein n=1 Tax=Helobdella robusta TaxID=6412 RepID=T1F450_HELRO|nr:hypothetical protein HELRODRAFT_171339 [Helobdella robusta]ESO05679.1 hypothetical protein HELRODRAFT_171339 [Helobdella robusta]
MQTQNQPSSSTTSHIHHNTIDPQRHHKHSSKHVNKQEFQLKSTINYRNNNNINYNNININYHINFSYNNNDHNYNNTCGLDVCRERIPSIRTTALFLLAVTCVVASRQTLHNGRNIVMQSYAK